MPKGRPKKEDSKTTKEVTTKEVAKKVAKKVAKVSVKEVDASKMVKKVKNADKELLLFRCTTKSKVLKKICGNLHFRHAGYVEVIVQIMEPNKQGSIRTHSLEVKVCTKCRTSYVTYDGIFYQLSEIDLDAWEKLEKELHKATGPGGQC